MEDWENCSKFPGNATAEYRRESACQTTRASFLNLEDWSKSLENAFFDDQHLTPPMENHLFLHQAIRCTNGNRSESGWIMAANFSPRIWEFEGVRRELGKRPLIMGIINVTPDSFSDGGRFLQTDAAVEQAVRLVEEGADILDVGGESTRPLSQPVDEVEELRRVIPVIQRLVARTSVPISVDTTKAEVAHQALQAGAKIVNDISALTLDPRMIDVCRQSSCGIIAMHMQGTPQTMQVDPQYSNVVQEIIDYFEARLNALAAVGIDRQRVVLDPGVGFGKTAQHNMQILSSIQRFRAPGRPVLIGHSRKRFLQKVIGRTVDERQFGTIGVSVAVAQQGVDIIRVHDVAANRDAINAFLAITEPSFRNILASDAS